MTLAREIESGSGGTTATDPMQGPSWAVRKHVHRYGSKSSSKPKKDNASSTSSGHGKAACFKTHNHDKKLHKLVDLLVRNTDLCTPSTSASLKTRDLLISGNSSALALVLAMERVPLMPGRLEKAPEPYE